MRDGIAAAGRRLLWRTLLTLTGGLRVVGEPPSAPCVIVANHSSHADTAALIAALPARCHPAAAAAADYWFGRTGRSLLCRWLCAAFPVRRGGGGGADLAAAAQLLACGHDVIVFPEGTRSRDGRLGPFHTGAVRLARMADSSVVPARIEGTRQLLPVSGTPHPARVTVRFGTPVPAVGPDGIREVTDRLRAAVIALGDTP